MYSKSKIEQIWKNIAMYHKRHSLKLRFGSEIMSWIWSKMAFVWSVASEALLQNSAFEKGKMGKTPGQKEIV